MAAASFTINDLRNAIERREVVPYFQPIVELRSGRLWGFEVLSRWQHPQLGIVPPDQFIHVAETSALIKPLFEAVVAQAFSCMPATFTDHLTLSINVAPCQMRDRSIADKILSLAAHAGFPLRQLVVEITETALLDNLEVSLAIIEELKAHRIRLALDDFGTGYSSLRRLNSLPLDEIKIDQSFVRSMSEQRESHKIAASIIGLGHSMGLMTIAEGVEDKNHADMLCYLGCEFGQGWFYGRPVPAKDVPAMIAQSVLAAPAGSRRLAEEMATHLEASPALRLSQLQAIYDGAPVGLCLLDSDFRYLSHNKLFAYLSTAPFGPRLGRTMEETNPIVFLQLEPYLRRALEGEAISNIEILSEKSDSHTQVNPQLVSLQPVRDETDDVTAISVAITDITLQKQLVQMLHEDQDHYRLTTELNRTYPYRADAEGNIVWAGRTGISGRKMTEVLGHGWHDAVHPDDLESIETKWSASLRAGTPYENEHRLRGADGTWHRVRGRAVPRRDEHGKIIGWYGLVEDLNEGKH